MFTKVGCIHVLKYKKGIYQVQRSISVHLVSKLTNLAIHIFSSYIKYLAYCRIWRWAVRTTCLSTGTEGITLKLITPMFHHVAEFISVMQKQCFCNINHHCIHARKILKCINLSQEHKISSYCNTKLFTVKIKKEKLLR